MTHRPARTTPFASPSVAAGALVVAVAAASALVGVLATAVGARTSPVVMLAVPVTGGVVVAMLRRPRVQVAVVLLTLPFGLRPAPLGLVAMQAVMVFVVGLSVVYAVYARTTPFAWSEVMLWPIAVILTACVALPQSINTRLATNQIVSLVAGLALALVVAAVCRSIADVRWAVHVLLAVGSAVCLLSLRGAGSLEAARGARRVDNRLRGTFTEPNQFGCFSAIVLVLAVSVFVAARTRVERAGALVAVVAALSALTLSLSRGAWIGAAVGVVVVVALRPQIWRTVALAAAPIALVLVGVASLGSLPEEFDVVRARISTLASPTDNPYDTRPAIWREARREIAEKPLTGHGPGQFEVVSKRTAGEGASASAYHAHNVLLTVGAEIGLLAVAFVVAFTLGLLRLVRSTLHRIPDDRDGALVAGLGGALAVIVGQGFVDFTLRNAVIFALLATLVGLLLAAAVAAASASARPDRRA